MRYLVFASKVIAHYAFFRKVSFFGDSSLQKKEKKNVALLDELTHFLNHRQPPPKMLSGKQIYGSLQFGSVHICLFLFFVIFFPHSGQYTSANLSPPFFF